MNVRIWQNRGMAIPSDTLIATARAVAALGADASAFGRLDDDGLLEAQRTISSLHQLTETYAAWAAGEIARRSPRELGYAGLAQRKGFASPEALIQSMTHTTRAEATRFVQVGTLLADVALATELSEPLPWQAEIAAAVSDGVLSLSAAESVRNGLGKPDAAVTTANLAAAASVLIGEAAHLSVDQLLRRARQLRDILDAEGIARREKQRRDDRYLKRWIRPDGMYQASMLLDPESGSIVFAALDAIISPRRGGPRFVDPEEQARADKVLDDPRSDLQLQADALVEMVKIATEADPGKLFGSRRPAVRVIVTEATMTKSAGHGYLEGNPDPVSFETIERHLCDTGIVGVKFDDDGQCINVGRTKRLFTGKQRIGLAVRDGGCLWPTCEKPASWAEAHHIKPWHSHHGKTDQADGVLLCRAHHMLVHDNHWEVIRERARYWLKPPRSEDPSQSLRPMRSKSPLMHQLFGERVPA
jgi:Domain of unknown function (DUF222)